MRRSRIVLALVLTLALSASLVPPAQGQDTTTEELSIWRVYVDTDEEIARLFADGYDILEARGDDYVLIVSSQVAVDNLRADGLRVREDRALDPTPTISDP